MPGLTLSETPSNVAGCIGAWTSLLQELAAYKAGTATQKDVIVAAAAFSGAITALSSSSPYAALFASGTGLAASAGSLSSDVQNFNTAYNAGDTTNQTYYLDQVVNDAAGVGGGIASAIGAVASAAGETGLATIAETVGAACSQIGAISAVVGVGIIAVNGLTNYLNALGNALVNGAVQQNLEILIFNSSDASGDQTILMPGQSGDLLTDSSLGGSAYQYNETGSQVGDVQLAENGASDAEYISGTDVVSDDSSSDINLADATNVEVDGNNNSFSVSNGQTSATIYGSNNSIQVVSTGSSSSLTLSGSDTLDLNNASNITVQLDTSTSGLTVSSEGNSSLTINSAPPGATIVGTSADNLSLSANNMTVDLVSGQYQLTGTGDLVNLGTAATVSLGGSFIGSVSSTESGNSISLIQATGFPSGYSQILTNNSTSLGLTIPESNTIVSAGGDGALVLNQFYNNEIVDSITLEASGSFSITGYRTDGTVQSITDYSANGTVTSAASFFEDGKVSQYQVDNADGTYVQALFDDGAAYAYELNFSSLTGPGMGVSYYEGTGQVEGIGGVEAFSETANQGDTFFSSIIMYNSPSGTLAGFGSYDPTDGEFISHSGTAPTSSPAVPDMPIPAFSYSQAAPLLPALPTSSFPMGSTVADQSSSAASTTTQVDALIQAMSSYSQAPIGGTSTVAVLNQDHSLALHGS